MSIWFFRSYGAISGVNETGRVGDEFEKPSGGGGSFREILVTPELSIGARIETVETLEFRMDIAKDKFLAMQVLPRFWRLREPPKDQVSNVKYFCDNAYSGLSHARKRFCRYPLDVSTLHEKL